MSMQSETTTDICKPASRPGYSFRLTADNLNESDATNTKGRRSEFRGFALCSKSKFEKTGHLAAGLHLSGRSTDRSDARPQRSSDLRGPRSDTKSKVHPTDGFFRYDDRISTFSTWPKSHPIHPQRYVKAGFYYSGEGDKVICPWCNLNLIEWETYDIPMEEHQKHSPYCAFVLMLNPFLNYHLL